MLFDNDLKDNLIVTREGGGRRRKFLGVLLLIVLAVFAAVFFGQRLIGRFRGAPEPDDAEIQASIPVDPGFRMMTRMRVLADDGKLVEARLKGLDALEQTSDPSVIEDVEKLLGEINIRLVSTPLAMPEKEDYLVKPGDSLERIARRFGTTVELLRKSNDLRRDMIHPGDLLRVFNGTFELKVSKSRNEMVVTMNDRFFKRYRVGTGKHGSTPAGVFRIADKIVEPPWWRPDGTVLPFGHEENVLGTRWMSISAIEGTPNVRGYGIHGTWEPETIGQQESQGCIRLLNADVEELYMLLPIGVRVVVVE